MSSGIRYTFFAEYLDNMKFFNLKLLKLIQLYQKRTFRAKY
jgi:hypothetical protein